jgi:hypothetical protein
MADSILQQTLQTARDLSSPITRFLFPDIDTKRGGRAATLNEKIAEAEAKGDKAAVRRLTSEAGVQSATVGAITGIPDLAIMGYNWASGDTVKDLRTRTLEAIGTPVKAGSPEEELTYNLPEYALMAVGIQQLAKGGWKGLKQFKDNRKVAEFVKELEKSSGPQSANRFKQFMATGQGSDNPMVYAALDQMKKNPKYAEMFTRLDKAAAEAAVRAMSPRPSSQTAQEAATGIVRSVQDRVNAVVKARNTAGDAQFTKAFALAGDRGLITPNKTLDALSDLRVRYLRSSTPDAQKTVKAIDDLQESLLVNGRAAPLSVPRYQALLEEFGKKVGAEESLFKGISQDNLTKINKAVFAGLKTDMDIALKTAPDVDAKRALGALESARVQFKNASDQYNSLVSQGIPKFLQNKSLDEVSIDDLTKAYKGLNQGQRTLFREWVGANRAESLQTLDRQVFQDFLGKAYKQLPDGTMGYDLGDLARSWDVLKKTDPNQADMLMQALGTNATEFSGRMKDALVFTRKMSIGAGTNEGLDVLNTLRKELPVAVGSIPAAGYPGAKATQLGLDTAQALLQQKKLPDELIARALLTKEGADFLKSAALSPGSRETLEKLTDLSSALPAGRAYTALSGVITGATPRGNMVEDVVIPGDDVFIPEDISASIEGSESDVYIPEELMEPNLGMDTTSPESALRPQVGPGGVLDRGNIDQLNLDVIAQDPDPRVQGLLTQIGYGQ